jgi:hypothetical protein
MCDHKISWPSFCQYKWDGAMEIVPLKIEQQVTEDLNLVLLTVIFFQRQVIHRPVLPSCQKVLLYLKHIKPFSFYVVTV